MATSRVIWNGTPGEVWTNRGTTIRYQLVCRFQNSCGFCIQYHLAISNWWPLGFHPRCRCRQTMVMPGGAAQPFVDFREIIDKLSWDQKVEAVGGSVFKLLERGVVTWDQVVTETRVRSFREIVAGRKLSIEAMTGAGVTPGRAKRAFDAVHTPAASLIKDHRKELLDRIRAAGLSDAQIKEAVSRKIAQRISVAGGGRGESFVPAGGPKPTTLPPDLLERIERGAKAKKLAFEPATLEKIRAKILANAAAGAVKLIPKPFVKEKTPLEKAFIEQRASNAADAIANPKITVQVENAATRSYRKLIAECDERIATLERERIDSRPAYDKLKAERDKWRDKASDYSLSKDTRQKWDKKYQDSLTEWLELHRKVEGADANIAVEKRIRAERERRLNASIKPVDIDYAANLSAHPNLIAPGPIKDRLEKYKVGDAKIEELKRLSTRTEKVGVRLATRRSELTRKIDELVQRQGDVIADAVATGRPVTLAESQEVAKLQKQIDAFIDQKERVRDIQYKLERTRSDRTVRIIKADQPILVTSSNPDRGAKNNSGTPLYDPTGQTKANIDRATEWLSQIIERGDGDFATAMNQKIGAGPGLRAHHAGVGPNQSYHIQVDIDELPDVVVHEFGHAIDEGVKIGDQNVVARSIEFKDYRLKGQVPVELSTKFSGFDPGERGADDEFGRSMSDRHAYYTGKDYGDRATEIMSMGLQYLYKDAENLARKDPEFCKFILGILDGSLR